MFFLFSAFLLAFSSFFTALPTSFPLTKTVSFEMQPAPVVTLEATSTESAPSDSVAPSSPLSPAEIARREPLPISRDQYTAALNQPAAHYLGSTVSNSYQGLEIHWEKYDAFFPYIVLSLSLPEIPGRERLLSEGSFDRSAYLTVARVLDRAGKNIYDAKNSFEEAPFDGINLQPIAELPGYLEGSREIHVLKGVKEADIRSVEGQVILDLPVNVRPLEFAPSELGKEKKTAGAAVSLTAVEGTTYTFDYLGKGGNFVKWMGYDAAGQPVPLLSHTADIPDALVEPTSIDATFESPVTKIKLFVADEIFTKTLPFQLNMEK